MWIGFHLLLCRSTRKREDRLCHILPTERLVPWKSLFCPTILLRTLTLNQCSLYKGRLLSPCVHMLPLARIGYVLGSHSHSSCKHPCITKPFLNPCKWKLLVPPTLRYPRTSLHVVTAQKTTSSFFIVVLSTKCDRHPCSSSLGDKTGGLTDGRAITTYPLCVHFMQLGQGKYKRI
jgi:hypothetical protein